MRPIEALILFARTAAVMAAVFGSVAAAAYAGLEIWDVTHPPMIPGWTAAPVLPHSARSVSAPG